MKICKIMLFLIIGAWVAAAAFAQAPPTQESADNQTATSASIVSAPVAPEPAVQDASKITLDIKGMDVVDVLQMLAKRSGMNVVVGRNVSGRVTLFLKNVDVKDAFDIVLLSNDLACETKGDITNVMTQQDYEMAYGSRYNDKKSLRIIKLQYAKPGDVARSLTQIKSNNGRVIPDDGSGTLTIIDSEQKIAAMEDFIKNTDLPLETRVFSLNYASAEKLSAKIQPLMTKDIGTFQIDDRTNKLIVTDYPDKLKNIEKIVKAFDEKTLQVVIDAQIVEINPDKDQFSMGVDWDYWFEKNMRFAGALPAPPLTDSPSIPNAFSFGVAAAGNDVTSAGHYKSVLDMLRVIGRTKILSSPRLMVLNNQEAKILVGTKEAYITSTVTQSNGSAVTSQSVNFVDVGIKLYVTPTISHEDFITMKIRPEISSSKRTDITSEGQVTQIPIVTTSESETTIMVKNNTTIVIAGLKKDQHEKEVKKMPFLGDIPLIGFFFRSTREEAIKTELVIFITPRIVTGEENIEYSSLTHDSDIERLQNISSQTK